ncbi:MAG TPA: beta-ketoacyl-[acyl-carrier-protein] synthase family protein [Thermoanaerobaculia bacterium]|nr:beta-ketoacyl-[acyl-carrier-protein] synthase family protein [Thermoanaerobaculia bacterium]
MTDQSRTARVAVSGIGVVAPGAVGVEAFCEMLREGRSAIREVERFDTSGLSAHCAALVESFPAKQYISPMKLRRMNALSRYALGATKLALEDQRLERIPSPSVEVGVSLGTTFGPVETSAEYFREYVARGASFAPPQLFAESVANAPGSHIAIELGYEGFNTTFTQRESSAMTALFHGATQIVKGGVRSVIAGGVEEINEIVFAVFDRMGALAHAEGTTTEASRPFDRRRNGIVIGEGAGVFVLVGEEAAKRGRPWGWIRGFGIGRDGSAPLSDWGADAGAVAATMARAIDDAGLVPEEIDAVWASASSSVRGDRLEARAIQQLFGSRIPPVVAVKGYFGEYAGAGALQIAAALVALHEQFLPASAGYEDADEEMKLPVVRSRAEQPVHHMLINSLSAGGGMISAVLSSDAE